MIYDWAVSLGIVTILVLGLVVTADVIFSSAENNYTLGAGLSNVASFIATHIDRVEAIEASATEPFFFNSSFVGVQLPKSVAGHPYSVEITQDFVVVSANVSGGTALSAYIGLSEPVHLLNASLAKGIQGSSLNSTWLDATEFNCLSFPYGVNFQAWEEGIILDGTNTYITTVFGMNGHDDTCPL